MVKKSPTQKFKISLDKLTRQIALNKANKMCEHCLSTNVLQANHIIPRTVEALRWDHRNIVILCRKCHLYWWHKDIVAAYEWAASIRDFNGLKLRRGVAEITKDNPDLQATKLYLENELVIWKS